MKRIYYLFIMVAALMSGNFQAQAQNNGGEQPMNAKEARKAERAIRKKIVAAENQQAFQAALQALKDQSFVVEVDQLIFPRAQCSFPLERSAHCFLSVRKRWT